MENSVTTTVKCGIEEELVRLEFEHLKKFGKLPKGFALGPMEYLSICEYFERKVFWRDRENGALAPVDIAYLDEFRGMTIELKAEPGISVLIADKKNAARYIAREKQEVEE